MKKARKQIYKNYNRKIEDLEQTIKSLSQQCQILEKKVESLEGMIF